VICVPITAGTQAGALRELEDSLSQADVVELRMDLIGDGNLKALMDGCRLPSADVSGVGKPRLSLVKIVSGVGKPQASPVKILVTNREGTDRSPDRTIEVERQRVTVLKEAVILGADFVDVELDVTDALLMEIRTAIRDHGNRTSLIISHHDFVKTPSVKALREIFHASVQAGADIVKIVTTACSPEDNLKILGLIPYARKHHQAIIAFCMGKMGRMSRIMAPFLGSILSFTPLNQDAASAPGQLTLGQMRRVMEIIDPEGIPSAPRKISLAPAGESRSVSGNVKVALPTPLVFAIFGNPVKQSLSPLMHNAALKKMNIDGTYVSFCVKDLEAAVNGVRGMDIRGISVTIPFKTDIMAYLDEVDDDALKIGAVNTLINDNGRLKGFNTDWTGLVQPLEDVLTIKGKVFAIVGAGGTARSAIFGILQKGGIPVVLSRNAERGASLAREWGCSFYPLNEAEKVKADCLINTTPVGMTPDIGKSPIDSVILQNFQCVVDVIYHPLRTKLLQDAERAGCMTVSGLDMFVNQGAEQLRLWTGQEPPRAFMKQIVMEKLRSS
jgi:shikimate dehydrogenase/3-dehydroquinate dehydratase type I